MRLINLLTVVFAGILMIKSAVANEAPIGEGVYELPIFDAHMHYHELAWSEVTPSLVIKMMDSVKDNTFTFASFV